MIFRSRKEEAEPKDSREEVPSEPRTVYGSITRTSNPDHYRCRIYRTPEGYFVEKLLRMMHGRRESWLAFSVSGPYADHVRARREGNKWLDELYPPTTRSDRSEEEWV